MRQMTPSMLGPLLIIFLCFVSWILEPFSGQELAYQRQQIINYYWWQLVTANLVHTNFTHLVLNTFGLCLLWLIHGQYYTIKGYLVSCLILGCSVTLGIFIFSHDLLWYAGFSGILHGLFVIGACKDIQNRVPLAWLLFAAVWLKIFYEQVFGQSEMVASLINANVAIDAHMYGGLTGLFIVLLTISFNFVKNRHQGT